MLGRSVRTLCISQCAVRSSVSRVVRFRSHLIELDSDENVGATGYDIVMQRAANIVFCNSDRQHFIKVLQLYPESNFVNFLSKATHIEIVGLTDKPEGSHQYERYYSSVERIADFSPAVDTGLRIGSFETVVSCTPFDPEYLKELSPSNLSPSTQNNVGALGIASLLHVLNGGGYLVLGAPSDQFARLGWKEQLAQFDAKGKGALMSFLKLKIPVHELLGQPVLKNEDEEGKSGAVSESVPAFPPTQLGSAQKRSPHFPFSSSASVPSVYYSIAVFRRG